MPRARKGTIGQRIKRYREDRGMSATQLAEKAKLSKSYISELESGETTRGPSAEVLYRIAQALGVAMSDLLGRPIIVDTTKGQRPESLVTFGKKYEVPEADLRMLERIVFRGDPPKTPERWSFIYQAIKNSAAMDG